MKTTVGFMVMALLLGTAHAREHKKIDEAKEHYFNGERAYRLGEFDRAIAEFKKSYDINPVPGILFNLGQSYYKNNDLKSAEHIFRQFIEESHDAPAVALARQKLAEIEKQSGTTPVEAAPVVPVPNAPTAVQNDTATPSVEAANVPVVPAVQVEKPKPRTRADVARNTTIALSIVTLVTAGVGAGLLGHAAAVDPKSATTLAQQRDLEAQGSNEKTAGIAMLSVGGAALVATAISFGLWMKYKKAPAPMALLEF